MTRAGSLPLALLLLAGGVAHAEPHLGARAGLRCARCHVTPTGGGKRTAYGALYAQSQLSLGGAAPRFVVPSRDGSPGKEGALLASLAVGEVTDWLAIGADLRLHNTTTLGSEKRNSFDATQGTLYLELRPLPERVTLYLDEELTAGGARNREAWGQLHGPAGSYLRGGRFLPPFGLRILDDAAYTRRATGATFANPDLGLELGLELGPLAAAFALSNGAFAGSSDTDSWKAVSGLVELGLDPVRVGLSGLYNPSEAGCRAMGALFAALRLGRLALLGELDLISDRAPEGTSWRHGLAAYLEADLALTKGLTLRASWDLHDADLELRQDRRQRFRFGLDLFVFRMAEVKAAYVIRQAETTEPADAADLLELVLHVFL
jgi:hypothetical protein